MLTYALGKFVAAVDEQGKVWVWGSNRSGNLALGDHQDRKVPRIPAPRLYAAN